MKYSLAIMKQLLFVLIGWLCVATQVSAEGGELRLGAERMEVVTRLLQGKRVGLVVNQTSILEHKQMHLLDALLAEGIDVHKVFAPEHGFRGTADAGEHVSSRTWIQGYKRCRCGNQRQPRCQDRRAYYLYLWEKQETDGRAVGRCGCGRV